MRIEDRLMDLSAEEGARVVALGLLAEAGEAAQALAAGSGEEPLHDFRVAVRRLRSALRTYRPWLAEGVRPRHERRLRRVARSTNGARDAEVQLAWLAPRRDALASPSHLPGHGLAVARYEARLHGGLDAARVAASFQRVVERLRRRLDRYERRVVAGGEEAPSFGAVLAALVEEHVAALVDRTSAIRDAGDVEGAHRARIEGKRLRYLLEPLRGYPRAEAVEVVDRLKRLQDVLGELHDAHVLAGELGAALVEVSAERARVVHDAILSGDGAALRERLRGSPRPGLVALLRLVRERRDALFADLEREWRGGGVAALASQARGLADALEARAGGRLEHERKLLLAALPPRAGAEEPVEILQGWLPGARLRERIRRVRRGEAADRYYRAVKRGSGPARLEAEEETTREVFETLWPLTEGRRIAKRRHRVRDGARVWEVDVFTDRDLVIAEVELPASETELEVPEWLRPLVLRDVTDDPAFRNENLAAAPAAPAAPAKAGGEAPPPPPGPTS